jgi:pSer/pThr/pTyr-binding forkhead associated (FHA) protein
MDNPKPLPEAAEQALPGPHWRRPKGPGTPEILPLRLTLQPGGLAVELTEPEAVIGRHSDVDLRLPLPDVSRRHCRLFFADGGWHLLDLGSLNGVYVNGERLQRARLHHGDRISLGGFTLEVDLGRQVPVVALRPDEPVKSGEVLQSIVNALPLAEDESPFPQRKAS